MANSAVYQAAEKQQMKLACKVHRSSGGAAGRQPLPRDAGPSWNEDSKLAINSTCDTLLFTVAQPDKEYVQAVVTSRLLDFLWKGKVGTNTFEMTKWSVLRKTMQYTSMHSHIKPFSAVYEPGPPRQP